MTKLLILLIYAFAVPLVCAKDMLKLPKENEVVASIEDAIATKLYSTIFKDSKQLFTALELAEYLGDDSDPDNLRVQYPWRYSDDYFFQTWIIATSKSKGLRIRIFKSISNKNVVYCCVSKLGSHKTFYYRLPSKM